MNKSNADVKLIAKGKGIPLWRVAMKMNISEQTLVRRLRIELSGEEKNRIISIINDLAMEV